MSETRICKQTGKEYIVTQAELDLLDKISPIFNSKKYLIPPSKYHPDVNHQRHLARRNERTLYRGKCTFTNEPIITNINPKQGYKETYNSKDRWGDAWEPFDYGVTFDTNKTFMSQFENMFNSIPQKAIQLSPHMDNCDYCNYGFYAKDCYMTTSPVWSEQCYYSFLPLRCYWDVDGYANTDCNYTYQCFYSMNCYKCQYATYCYDCKNSQFLLDCRNCDYCFGCINLSQKKYHIFNKAYDKKTYFQAIENMKNKYSIQDIYSKFIEFSLTFPRRATRGSKNENSVGDLNFNTKDCQYCFDVQDCKNSMHCRVGGIQTSDMHHCDMSGISTRLYQCIGTAQSDSCAFCLSGGESYQCFYCMDCRDCEYCFGCIRIMHKKYCIFNKQYTQEEYDKEVGKIIGRMIETGERGEFFSPSYSNFPYNDTDAYERFPEDKETILARGWKWIDKEEKPFEGEEYIPEPIKVYQQDESKRQELLNGTLVCEITKKPYKTIKQELDFYIKFDIEIPRKHPDQRYKERIKHWRLPRNLFERKCANPAASDGAGTGKDILTPYAQDRPEIVWSEEAWDQEFLG